MLDYNNIQNYDERYISEECIRENRAIADVLNQYIIPDDKVLDLGCGTGFSLDICEKIDPSKYIGIDISPKMIKEARIKHLHPAKFVVARAGDIRIPERDVVLCLFSIPYLGMASIPRIYQNLKKGGVLIAVYYDKPYLNEASVYSGKKIEYLFRVKPKVKQFIRQLRKQFTEIDTMPLTDKDTYKISIFIKE